MIALGIDLGTSSVKAVLLARDEPGGAERVLDEASVPLALSRPHPGWSEQDPAAWWQATLGAVDALATRRADAFARLGGIGLSGQQHGAVLLGADGEVLRPAILWNDTRSGPECAELSRACPEIERITGNAVMPGFTAPKLLWVRRHEPGVSGRVARVLLPKDFLRFRLSGDFVSEMSDASGTGWLDVGARDWSDAALAATGLARDAMPELVEGSAVSARLLPELARRWGVTDSVPIAGGGGDNAAAACGIGALRAGEAFVSLGTSGVLFAATDRFRPNVAGGVHSFCHAVPDTWHQMGVILSATDSLNWLARIVGRESRSLADAVEARGIAGPSAATFLPYLGGERTPHNDPALRGAFAGLGHAADAESLAQAVMEGVAFAFCDCARVLAEAGTVVERAWAVGGGAASAVWLRIMASVLRIELLLPAGAALGAAVGAARLAICAATAEDPHAVCAKPAVARRIAPDAALAEAYAERYATYRRLAELAAAGG